MIISCPHCQGSLDISPELYGQVVQCPLCKGKISLADVDVPEEVDQSGQQKPKREGWAEEDHANVNFLHAFLMGFGASVVWLAIMAIPPVRQNIGAIFLDRGWVNYAETWFFFWGLAILFLKYFKVKNQQRSLLINLFPIHLGDEVNSISVGPFIDNIYQIPVAMRDSIIVNRIRKALELFEIRNSKGETEALLGTMSDVDANRSAGSFSLVKVFLWAIPILGFIGTVQGLSTAVGSLSMESSDPEALKSSIKNLTGGLGVAFDTTLLGLILSMFMSFPLAAVQKMEDETLTLIDAFCAEKLLPKLNESSGAPKGDILEKASSVPELIDSLSVAHATFLDNLNASTIQLKHTSELLNRQLAEHQAATHDIQQNMLGITTTITNSFVSATERLGRATSELITKSENDLQSTFDRLALGIDLLNNSLRSLGSEQIPGTQRKGFFSKLFKG
jgi:hypothetical protein